MYLVLYLVPTIHVKGALSYSNKEKNKIKH